MTAVDLICWLRWADAADGEIIKEMRAARVWRHVFPDGLESEEKEKRERMVERARALGDTDDWKGWPEPCEPPDQIKIEVPESKPIEDKEPLRWEGLIAKSSKAYRRGSLHDGTADEVDQMRAESKGSPFDVGKRRR